MGKLGELAPASVEAFMGLHHAATAPGALDTKTKELLSIAIAIATHCGTCIDCHVHDAIAAGATREEIGEVVGVAILMGGGPSVVYGCQVLDAFDEFTAAK
jgi:AhpD family alkylhydroperoxidase